MYKVPTKEWLLQEDSEEKETLIKPIVSGRITEVLVDVLIDTGSEVSIISQEMFQVLRKTVNYPVLPVTGVSIKGITGIKGQTVKQETRLPITLGNFTFFQTLLVIPKINVPLLLGLDWLLKFEVTINFKNKSITGKIEGFEFSVPFLRLGDNPLITDNIKIDTSLTTLCVNKGEENESNLLKDKAEESSSLSMEQKVDLYRILSKYNKVFSNKPGIIKDYVCEFKVKGNEPFFCKPYPVPFNLKPSVKVEINKMLDQGIIERSNSAFNNPMFVVRKSSGEVRLVLDARTLNKHIEMERDRPICIDEILSKFQEAKFFSSMDLTAGYYQIRLHEQSKPYTAFIFDGRSYHFNVLPFGLNISVSVFIRALDKAIGRELMQELIVYVDDILIISKTWEEHCLLLEKTLDKLEKEGITIKLSKSHFGREELKFLGHVIGINGIKPDPDRLEALKECPEPQTVKQLKAYLGLAGFYRRFLQGHLMSDPRLLNLLKKNTVWDWNDGAKEAFNNIKSALLEAPILKHPSLGLPFKLATDASSYGIAGEVFQGEWDPNIGEHNTIAFASRCLNKHEMNYTATEKELLAIIWCLKKFENLLWGSKVIIYTDHQALTFLMESKLLHGRLIRWMLFLQNFYIEIEYIKGSTNVVPDALSRMPLGMKVLPKNDSQEIIFGINFLNISYSSDQVRKMANRIRIDIQKDPEFQKSFLLCAQNKTKFFKIIDGALFWRNNPDKNNWKLCIPRTVQTQLIWFIHTGYGHFGIRKCIKHMVKYYYFKNLSRKVICQLRTCEVCQKVKESNNHFSYLMYPIIPKCLHDITACDLYGPLPTSIGGVKYIVVFVECWSKFTCLYPIKQATSDVVLKCLQKFIDNVGKPLRFLSDNGTQFTSGEFRNFLRWEGIKHITISKYHPQSNPCERIMKELSRLFRTFCPNKHSSWAKWVPEFQTILNELPHLSTGLTPVEILDKKFIGEPILKFFTWPPLESSSINHKQSMVEHNLKHSAEQRTKKHNLSAVIPSFAVGDLVLVRDFHQSSNLKKETSKFFPRYCGPFKIISIPHPKAVFLVDPHNNVEKGLYNVEMIKPFHTIPPGEESRYNSSVH